MAKEEDIEEDYVDSDFDIDENEDEPVEVDGDEEDEEKRRLRALKRRGVITKAYKVLLTYECQFDKIEFKYVYHKDPAIAKTQPPRKPKPAPTNEEVAAASNLPTNESTSGIAVGKSLRSSTAKKREELEQKQQEREARKVKVLKKQGHPDIAEIRRLTQEELLAEAKITEKINLASLG